MQFELGATIWKWVLGFYRRCGRRRDDGESPCLQNKNMIFLRNSHTHRAIDHVWFSCFGHLQQNSVVVYNSDSFINREKEKEKEDQNIYFYSCCYYNCVENNMITSADWWECFQVYFIEQLSHFQCCFTTERTSWQSRNDSELNKKEGTWADRRNADDGL